MKRLLLIVVMLVMLLVGCQKPDPLKTAKDYLDCWSRKEYQDMYGHLSSHSRKAIDRETFAKRYENIFSSIQLNQIDISTQEPISEGDETYIPFKAVFSTNTVGTFEEYYTLPMVLEEKEWRVKWSPSLIFPQLEEGDKVKLTELHARRGDIADRNGHPVVVEGEAYTVGAVPGKIPDKDEFAKALAPLLEVKQEYILNKLNQKWVKDDTLVPLRNFPLSIPQEFKDSLLSIKGLMLTTNIVKDSRRYLANDLYAHVIGYTQRVSEEDLKDKADMGYDSNDLIGRQGIEAAMEDVLHGTKGYSLYVEDKSGDKKAVIAQRPPQHGNNITLTLDPRLQSLSYDQIKGHKGAIVALDPKSGEVLAMISSPSYNPNIFPNGVLPSEWKELSQNPDKPFINRCTYGLYPPGSTFKPFTAVIALEEGIITPNTVVEAAQNLSWRPSTNWNAPPIRRIPHPPGDVNLDRALVWSDNIYFAWTALKIGAQNFESFCSRFGMGKLLPFHLNVSQSIVKRKDTQWSPHLLAGSSHGQGEMLATPLQMAAMYTGFLNNGNMLLPRLVKEITDSDGKILESAQPDIWNKNAIPPEWIDVIIPSLVRVVEDPTGTGHRAAVQGLEIAAKTGTAQLDDEGRREIAWFIGFTLDTDKPLLLTIMLEVPAGEGGVKLDMAREIFTHYYFEE